MTGPQASLLAIKRQPGRLRSSPIAECRLISDLKSSVKQEVDQGRRPIGNRKSAIGNLLLLVLIDIDVFSVDDIIFA